MDQLDQMSTQDAIETATAWIAANLPDWPGLLAAHLVGGVTSMSPSAPFPPAKDVDIHLVIAEGSPALQPTGPFMNIIETAYGGILIEAGIKSVTEYESAAAILANPEIAYHLTRDSVLYDPSGLLTALQPAIQRDYARPEWVQARIEHERRGIAGALALRPMAAAMYGASGEVQILGYATTFLPAVLQVAALAPPRMGGRAWVHLRDILQAEGRTDLYEEVLGIMGVGEARPERVAELLDQGAGLFDLAIGVKRTPHPFEHKLHAQGRPYFVDSCAGMIAEGHHREALGWITPFTLAATDVILADGPDNEFARTVACQGRFLRELGMDSPEERVRRLNRADHVFTEIFALADEIAAARMGMALTTPTPPLPILGEGGLSA